MLSMPLQCTLTDLLGADQGHRKPEEGPPEKYAILKAVTASVVTVTSDESTVSFNRNQTMGIHGIEETEKEIMGANRDIRDLLRALPTKTDIQQLIATVERSCKQAVEDLREEVVAVGNRVEVLEIGQEETTQAVGNFQDTVKHHKELLNFYRDQLDDFENRDHRENIRIQDLPE